MQGSCTTHWFVWKLGRCQLFFSLWKSPAPRAIQYNAMSHSWFQVGVWLFVVRMSLSLSVDLCQNFTNTLIAIQADCNDVVNLVYLFKKVWFFFFTLIFVRKYWKNYLTFQKLVMSLNQNIVLASEIGLVWDDGNMRFICVPSCVNTVVCRLLPISLSSDDIWPFTGFNSFLTCCYMRWHRTVLQDFFYFLLTQAKCKLKKILWCFNILSFYFF